MSQTRFGDASSQEQVTLGANIPEPDSLSDTLNSSDGYADNQPPFNKLTRQMLEQELYLCNERSQQAHILLRQAQEQLQLSQMVIQRQETLTQTLQSRIDQLERELQDVHSNCDELRDRLKRQQHHTSQLKAALERCLDTAPPASQPSSSETALSALESWSVAKLAEEKIAPLESRDNASALQNVLEQNVLESVTNVIKITPPQDISSVDQPQATPAEISESPDILGKHQPISPLIVRPHKAYQGSPLSINLPKLKIETTSLEQNAEYEASSRDGSMAIAHDLENSSLSNTRPTVLHRVTAPKFLQKLGNIDEIPDQHQGYEQNHGTDAQQQLAIASSRKPVTSMASVQLPQFPPLPRR
jgi:hypothetical protein